MPSHPQRTSPVTTLSLFLAVALAFTLGTRLVAAGSDCVGKPYGTAGCPTRPASASSAPAASSASTAGYCGNGTVEAGEQCDNGRANGKTECSATCTVLYCGDSILSRELREECDSPVQEYYIEDPSGNLTTEMRFADPPSCGWSCQPPVCTADGVCSGGCKRTYLGDCPVSAAPVSAPSPSSSSAASVQEHAAASSVPSIAASSSALPVALCGDGILQTGETCDDGNDVNDDGCSNACILPKCGDAIVQKPEECDSGTENSDTKPDACRTSCKKSLCGDAVVDRGEQCDTGERNSSTKPNACRTSCTAPSCGDGIVDRGEQCDAGAKNSDTVPNACRTSCKKSQCGDNVIDKGETCDGGKDCAKNCRPALPPVAAVSSPRSPSKNPASRRMKTPGRKGKVTTPPPADSPLSDMTLPIALGAGGVVIVSTVLFLFRKKIPSPFKETTVVPVTAVPPAPVKLPPAGTTSPSPLPGTSPPSSTSPSQTPV